MGRRRAAALGGDELVACTDPLDDAARDLADEFGGKSVARLQDVLAERPDAVIVAATPDRLAELTCTVLEAGIPVLVEKPAGTGVADVDRIGDVARRSNRMVKVGFNHRFFPGIAQAIALARSGNFGDVMYVRARYGHGGRPGYGQEWRADPRRSGGGQLVDQGMHLLDLSHALLGPLPLHSVMLRNQYWGAPVDENAVVILGSGVVDEPWALLHVSWTEWKNMFSLEIFCREAKLQVDGLVRSYGPQRLRIYRMGPEPGPPELEELNFGPADVSFEEEWKSFRDCLRAEGSAPVGDPLEDIRYAWGIVEEAYTRGAGTVDDRQRSGW
jgi:predicted dehydrogenase